MSLLYISKENKNSWWEIGGKKLPPLTERRY
jgi:hypothetical protein